MTRRSIVLRVGAVLLAVVMGACAKKVAPAAGPTPPQQAATAIQPAAPPPAPPSDRVPAPPAIPEDPTLTGQDRDALSPVFFELDSTDLSREAQATLQKNAGVLKQNGAWQVTIEGHCDERGSAQYNLALGERRAIAARDYLVSLGIGVNRVRIVSYGNEFPFEPAHEEAAWSKNRRAHFVITASR